jgi:hypothetical protein
MNRQSVDCKAVYRECLADVEGIYSLFQNDRCTNIPLARERLAELKANWKERIRQSKGTDVEGVVTEALSCIVVKSNSRPDGHWTSDLYSARFDLTFHLEHAAR